MDQNPRTLMAVGLEMPNGKWELFDDGTICFSGTGELSGQGYRICQNQIRRVELRGFEVITSHQFAQLPKLEEVDLGPDTWIVESCAFYACPLLERVSNTQGVVFEEDAFSDTPYGSQNTPGDEECGPSDLAQAFWAEMERCLASLQRPRKDSFQLLPAINVLRAGAESRDPELMYLWAEFLQYGEKALYWTFGNDYRDSIQYLIDDEEDMESLDDPNYWYALSAEAGYVPAICHMGWQALHGIGREPDPEAARRWFALVKNRPVLWLEPENLDLFARTASELEDLAHEADIDEDYHCCDLDWSAPIVTWRDLHGAALAVYQLGCMFGCLQCANPGQVHLVYDYGYHESVFSRYLTRYALEKNLMKIWCALEGILRASPASLRHWLAIAMYIQEETRVTNKRQQQLLEELTARVIRL